MKITSSTGTRPRSSPVSQTRLQGGFAIRMMHYDLPKQTINRYSLITVYFYDKVLLNYIYFNLLGVASCGSLRPWPWSHRPCSHHWIIVVDGWRFCCSGPSTFRSLSDCADKTTNRHDHGSLSHIWRRINHFCRINTFALSHHTGEWNANFCNIFQIDKASARCRFEQNSAAQSLLHVVLHDNQV